MAGAPDLRWRARIELALRVVAPALDLALAGADRISRLLHPGEGSPVAARMARAGEAAPRGLRPNR